MSQSGHGSSDRRAAWAVAFEHHFIDLATFKLARASHDRFLDVVGGHGNGLRRRDRRPKAGIAIRIAAAARGNGDFLNESGKKFAALRVGGSLFMLDGCPFRVA